MRGILVALAGAALEMGAVSSAQGHAFLDHASPAVGSSIPASPTVLVLWFTEDLEPAFSGVKVTNEAGKQVDLGNAQIPQGSPAELQIGLNRCRRGPTWSAGTSSRSTPIRAKVLSPSTSDRKPRNGPNCG